MKLKHKVCINVDNAGGRTERVLRGGSMNIRQRLLRFLFGEKVHVLVVTPGESVSTVEIRETERIKGEHDEEQH